MKVTQLLSFSPNNKLQNIPDIVILKEKLYYELYILYNYTKNQTMRSSAKTTLLQFIVMLAAAVLHSTTPASFMCA